MPNALDTVQPISNLSIETLKLAFEASRSPLVITDTQLEDNPIIYANQAFLDLTGYEMDEIIGRNCRFLQGKDSRKQAVRQLRTAIDSNKSVRTTLKNYRKDGEEFWNDLIVSPIADKKGNVTHFVGMQLDITERVSGEENLKAKTRELEDSNHELEQFTYATSHDLQEPLRMISSYLQLIQKRYSNVLDEDGITFLNFALEGAERMQALILDLLTLSRIDLAEDRFSITPMSQPIDRAQANLHMAITENQTTIEVSEAARSNELSIEPLQITQVFQNLIGNAIKYKAKDRSPQIKIDAKIKGPMIEYSVSDNGIGIEPQHFKRIFIIFQRLHTRSEYPGTGIGLAICSKIIDRHGGKIWVENNKPEGSNFKFSLPRNRQS